MLKNRVSEHALVSENNNLLIRTVAKIGVATVTKYAWFTNANKRSECKLLKESSKTEWDYLKSKGLLFAEIDGDDNSDQEAPVYKEEWTVWIKTSGSPSCWTDWQFEAGGFASEEDAYDFAEHVTNLRLEEESRAYEQYGNNLNHDIIVTLETENPND